jgi:hypothetical protein
MVVLAGGDIIMPRPDETTSAGIERMEAHHVVDE